MPKLIMTYFDDIAIHFIVGTGRSGTTLLSQILNRHPDVLSTIETQFILYFYERYGKGKRDISGIKKDMHDYYENLKKSRNIPHKAGHFIWNFDESYLNKVLQQPDDDKLYANVCKAFLLGFQFLNTQNDHTKIIIDKNPSYSTWTKELSAIFPEAKFLVAVRDYRAVANSMKQSPGFVAIDKLVKSPFFWQLQNKHLLECQKKRPQQFMIVRYEDLVDKKESVVQTVCAFLGITFSENMLAQDEVLQKKFDQYTEAEQASPRELKKWTDLTRPVNNARKTSWQTELSHPEIAFAEWWCGKTGQMLGYEPSLQLSSFQKTAVIVRNLPHIAIFVVLYFLYIRHYYRIPLKARQWIVWTIKQVKSKFSKL